MEEVASANRGLPVVEWGLAQTPFPGETVSGDRAAVLCFAGGARLAVVDALGHGEDAAAAAEAATRSLALYPTAPLPLLFQRCHELLSRTRGVVMTVAVLDARARALQWAAVGNVMGVVVHAAPGDRSRREVVRMRGGVVGSALPAVRPASLGIAPGDLVALASDGIDDRFDSELIPEDPVQEIADRVLARHRRGNDDAIALIARYLGERP